MAIVGYQAEVEKISAKIADIKVQLPLPGRIASGGCGTAMRRCARRADRRTGHLSSGRRIWPERGGRHFYG